jgi:hypothetical protein
MQLGTVWKCRWACAAVGVALASTSVRAAATVWDFNGNLSPTSGPGVIDFFNGDASWASYGTDTINGSPANVINLAAAAPAQALRVTHNGAPNGTLSDGVTPAPGVNRYTIAMDIKFPTVSGWTSFMQTNVANTNDGDWFRNAAGGIGISNQYAGTMTSGTWHRIALAVDLTAAAVSDKYRCYIDGTFVNSPDLGAEGGAGGRFELDPTFFLLADEDGETNAASVNSILFVDRTLTGGEIAALGGATAGGLASAVPEPTAGALIGLAGCAAMARRRGRNVSRA